MVSLSQLMTSIFDSLLRMVVGTGCVQVLPPSRLSAVYDTSDFTPAPQPVLPGQVRVNIRMVPSGRRQSAGSRMRLPSSAERMGPFSHVSPSSWEKIDANCAEVVYPEAHCLWRRTRWCRHPAGRCRWRRGRSGCPRAAPAPMCGRRPSFACPQLVPAVAPGGEVHLGVQQNFANRRMICPLLLLRNTGSWQQ